MRSRCVSTFWFSWFEFCVLTFRFFLLAERMDYGLGDVCSCIRVSAPTVFVLLSHLLYLANFWHAKKSSKGSYHVIEHRSPTLGFLPGFHLFPLIILSVLGVSRLVSHIMLSGPVTATDRRHNYTFLRSVSPPSSTSPPSIPT